MSFTIVKINLTSDNSIFMTTHGNNLQFLIQLHSPSFCLILAQNQWELLFGHCLYVHTVLQARLEVVTCFEM